MAKSFAVWQPKFQVLGTALQGLSSRFGPGLTARIRQRHRSLPEQEQEDQVSCSPLPLWQGLADEQVLVQEELG